MATKRSTRRKQPFVIEPLNWVAPEDARDEAEKNTSDVKKPAPLRAGFRHQQVLIGPGLYGCK